MFSKSTKFGRTMMILAFVITAGLIFSGCGEKVYKVGILSGVNFFASTADGFKAKMTELNYTEGKNISYDLEKGNSDPENYKRILKKFVSDKVDLIFVFPGGLADYADEAVKGTKIPVLFANSDIGAVAIQRFELMHKLVPNAKRMLVPYNRANIVVPRQLAVLRPRMAAAGVTMVELPVLSAAYIENDLQTRAKSGDIGFDAILMIIEPLAISPEGFCALGKFAADHKIPIGGAIMMVGGYRSIFGVDMNNVAVGKEAASVADKIIKGDTGVSKTIVPENYIQINYKAIQELGLSVDNDILSRANKVIQ